MVEITSESWRAGRRRGDGGADRPRAGPRRRPVANSWPPCPGSGHRRGDRPAQELDIL